MPDTKTLLRETRDLIAPPEDVVASLERRRRRQDRNRRVAAGVLGIAVFALAAIGFARLLGSERTPASQTSSPFEGTWISTSDADGGTQTMIVSVSAEGAVEITVRDDVATVCGGNPSTMTGTGRIEGGTQLVIPAPAYTCDDGSEPEALSGPPLEEQLRDWTLVHDPQNDALSDGFGGLWQRAGADGGEPLADLEPVWPQTSLEEVRQAQELADAGDPRHTWQVVPGLEGQLGQNHPSDGEPFFARFLEEELGWDEFLWTEAFAHRGGLDPGDVVYVRCAPGGTNPLYPDDPESGCAPTIDEFRYETVKIHAAQLDRRGDRGIWVVTGWEMIEPAEQIAPPTDAEIAASVGGLLQARIDGAGAEGFADLAEFDPLADVRIDPEIPLLYATSTGAPYERSESEPVEGPVWPEGSMRFEVRLFAENGETVVEQVFSLERDETGRLRLVYDFEPEGPDGRVLATTENGKAVPEEYGFLGGEVTYRATSPVAPREGTLWDQRPDVATVVGAGERRLLLLLADPRPIGPGCEEAPAPADAEGLARSIRSDPDLEADAPVAVTIGGIPALQMDVVMAPDASACPWQMPSLSSTTPLLLEHAPFVVQGTDRARLYLLDLPGGSARVLAIAIMSDEDSFERALALTSPIVDSIEFHAR